MKFNKQVEELAILSGLQSTTVQEIIKHGKVVEVKKGTIIMRYRESVDQIYIQLSGKSMEYVLTHQGRRKILFILGVGSLLNGYIFNDINSSVYCVTLEKSEFLIIPIDDFEKIMAKDFQLTKKVIMNQEKKFGRLSHQLKNTTSNISMEKKLLAKLWKLSRDFGQDTNEGREIDLNMSITFLADLLGASREAASRLCRNLVNEGYIKIHKKRFTILNAQELASYFKKENPVTI